MYTIHLVEQEIRDRGLTAGAFIKTPGTMARRPIVYLDMDGVTYVCHWECLREDGTTYRTMGTYDIDPARAMEEYTKRLKEYGQDLTIAMTRSSEGDVGFAAAD